MPPEFVFLRKYLGWSGADFAWNMHFDRAQVSKWENGKVEMSKPYELLLREMVASGKKIEDTSAMRSPGRKCSRPARCSCSFRRRGGRKRREK